MLPPRAEMFDVPRVHAPLQQSALGAEVPHGCSNARASFAPRTSPVKACDAMPRRRRVSASAPCAAFVTFTSVAVFVHIFVDSRLLLCISALKAAAGEQISQITHRLFFRGERFLALSRSSSSGRSGSTA